MIKDVILSPIAEKDYENVLDYLYEEFGALAVRNFIRRFEEVSSLISKNPDIYPYLSISKQIRRCVVTKHNVIYFKEYKTLIRIITMFDTRQNPNKLDKFI